MITSIIWGTVPSWQFLYDIFFVVQFLHDIQGAPQKRGISECCTVCSTAQLMLSLEFSFPIHLKIEIHVFVPSTEPFLSDIRELRNKFFNYPIWQQLLASSKSSSIKRIIHRITVVNSQQCDTCWVNKLGKP